MSPSLTPEAASFLAAREVPPTELTITNGSNGDLPLGRGGALNHDVPAARTWAENVAAGNLHTIADLAFGEDRFTTCAACDFEVRDARDDEEQADRWNSHAVAMKRQHRARQSVIVPIFDSTSDPS